MPLLFLNGGAMRGGPLHHLLRGAPLVGIVRTAARYRFYSVGDRFPALAERDPEITDPMKEVGGASGVSVMGELYDVPWEVLRESLLPAEPEELELGVIELADGSGALAMIRRRPYVESGGEFRDISEYADWRAYTASMVAPHVGASKGD